MRYLVVRSSGEEYWSVIDEDELLCYVHRSKAKCAAVAEFLADDVSACRDGIAAWIERNRGAVHPLRQALEDNS